MARTPNRFGGGSRTNEYGLFFEQTTDLNEALRDAGFDIINKYDVYYNNKFIGRSINKRARVWKKVCKLRSSMIS